MKKKIGIFIVAIIACAMFFNANLSQNTKSDVNLASLIAINIANAEGSNPFCCDDPGDTCKVYGTTIQDCDESEVCNGCKS